MVPRPLRNLESINACDRQEFLACLGPIFEHSPWIAERSFADRPFNSVRALHAAMMRVVEAAGPDEQIALLRRHPELAGREAMAGTMTDASTGEQGRLGLTRLTPGEFKRITTLNNAYREKFGFPCIVALSLHGERSSVLDEMELRLGGRRDDEVAAAIGQIGHITWGRLAAMFGDG